MANRISRWPKRQRCLHGLPLLRRHDTSLSIGRTLRHLRNGFFDQIANLYGNFTTVPLNNQLPFSIIWGAHAEATRSAFFLRGDCARLVRKRSLGNANRVKTHGNQCEFLPFLANVPIIFLSLRAHFLDVGQCDG